MIDYKTVFKNHLDTKQISDDNLRRFAQDHLGRLNAFTTQNGGTNPIFDTMYQLTKQLTDSFVVTISNEDYMFASQQASTIQVDEITKQFKEMISRKEGAVRSEFGVNSVEYQKFFPQGLTEYSQVTRSNIETLLDRVVNAATEYKNILGQNFLTIFVDLKDAYTIARTNQLNLIGSVNHKKLDTENARQALEIQIGKNVLQLAIIHFGEPEMMIEYFDQSIIKRSYSSQSENEDGAIIGIVNENSIENIENTGIKPNTSFTLKNTGSIPLTFAICPNDMTIPTNTGINVPPNATYYASTGQLGNSNDTFLNVLNSSATQKGSYEVIIL